MLGDSLVFGYKKDKPEELVVKNFSEEDISNKNFKEILDNQAVSKKAKEWAKENLDYFTFSEIDEWCAYGIYYDMDEIPEVDLDNYSDRLTEWIVGSGKEFVFMYLPWARKKNERIKRLEVPLWKNRDKAKNKQEAIEYLARAVSMNFPMEGGALPQDMFDYAKEWGIPFEPKLIRQAGYYFNNFDCPSWDSSSKYC